MNVQSHINCTSWIQWEIVYGLNLKISFVLKLLEMINKWVTIVTKYFHNYWRIKLSLKFKTTLSYIYGTSIITVIYDTIIIPVACKLIPDTGPSCAWGTKKTSVSIQ